MSLLKLLLCCLHVIVITYTINRFFIINEELIFRLHLVDRNFFFIFFFRGINLYVLNVLFLFLKLHFTDTLRILLAINILKSLRFFSEYPSLNSYFINSGKKVGLIYVWMLILFRFILFEIDLLISILFVFECVFDFFHVNNTIDLFCGEFAETVLFVGFDDFLVHF